MKTLFRAVVLLLLVVGWGLAALSLHVVRTPGEIPVTIVTKEKLSVNDIYVDTTTWTMDDVPRHSDVVERLLASGKADALKHVVDPHGGDVAQQLGDALGRAADEGPAEHLARRAGFRWPWENR
jgi:hypothetical protein